MSDVPVLPDEDDEDALPMLMDSPQCVGFGIFVIWWVKMSIEVCDRSTTDYSELWISKNSILSIQIILFLFYSRDSGRVL